MSLLNFQSDTKNKLQSPVETGVSVRGMGKENVERDKNMAYTCTQDAAIGWKRILSKKKDTFADVSKHKVAGSLDE